MAPWLQLNMIYPSPLWLVGLFVSILILRSRRSEIVTMTGVLRLYPQFNLKAIMSNTPGENVGTRLLFENERVRVWDLALAPGESLEKHVHHNDYLFVVIEGGELLHIDPEHPEKNQEVQYETDQVVFLEAGSGLIHNELVNVGDKPYRNLVIELKQR